jgi:hypothetical protein
MRVVPYINGRIFDVGTEAWTANEMIAQKAASKQNVDILNATEQNLTMWHESYGS